MKRIAALLIAAALATVSSCAHVNPGQVILSCGIDAAKDPRVIAAVQAALRAPDFMAALAALAIQLGPLGAETVICVINGLLQNPAPGLDGVSAAHGRAYLQAHGYGAPQMALTQRGLGYKRDPPKPPGAKPDHDAAQTLGTAPPPPASSNFNLIVDILDQGAASTCVGNAIPQAVRMRHVKDGIASPKLMSRLFGYYVSRAEHQSQHVDEGTYLRTFFQALKAYGFCPEALWPYDLDNLERMPSSAAFRAAYDQNNPTIYQRISSVGAARIDDIKRAVAGGYGVCFGTDVSEDFCAGRLGDGPIGPPVGLQIAGGHALCAVAYDGSEFTIVNSWSSGWGDGGFCTFSADYLAWPMTTDLWIVAAAPNYSE